ncbi:MAG: mandelate racemase/muconate lactonizing enzyme family protein, partial [Actinobacteria bacterium]|nr:mandelate racemase/muconate lactonizing enzyme family protein [Actinomycetota bacterium]
MKIRDVSALSCNPGTFNYVYAKVETDEGLTGYGECSLMPGAVEGALRTMRDYLVGQDARRIEQIWSSLYYMWHNVRGGVVFTAAMSGIDVALWDIKGKFFNIPVWRLLGGAQKSIPSYLTYGFRTYSRE